MYQLVEVALFMIFVLTFTSNSFNVATGARLLVNKMVGMNREEANRRRKRWMIMFTQSVIQDCLHLIDIVNATWIWKLSDELWFQFLFSILSFVVIYTIDGVVMFIFNADVHPAWFKKLIEIKRTKRSNVIIVASKASTSNT
uniref:7TM_GPCR_Srx domain-containing protein n=1 Tax=Caenorhabditis tropicalis TaxID=1561998 RepID=A0A1I7U2D2_9PELO